MDVEFNIPHATFSIDVETDEAGGEKKFYSIAVRFDAFGPDGYSLFGETLTTDSGEIYNTHIPNGTANQDEDRLLVSAVNDQTFD